MRFVLIFAPILLAACTDDDTLSEVAQPDAAETSTSGGGCDYECFPGAICADGVVSVSTGTQPTCGMCGGTTYKCKKGCRTDDAGYTSGVFADDLLCEESRVKHVGDPCEEQLDCTPTEGDDAGGISPALYCDAGKCAASEDASSDGG
jgi:hypothetical protein